jgi:IclR family transcriptional regulator, acetate operon repressor
MVRLKDAVNETVHLAVPDGLHCMVVADRVDCSHAVRTFHEIGDTSPLHATAGGAPYSRTCPPPTSTNLLPGGWRATARTRSQMHGVTFLDLDGVPTSSRFARGHVLSVIDWSRLLGQAEQHLADDAALDL